MKIPVAILGPGNIGTDLYFKLRRSEHLDPRWMIGIQDSPGLRLARERGLRCTDQGLAAVLADLAKGGIRLAFDATSAAVHRQHAPLLASAGIRCVDLTPAALGPYCVPPVNLLTLTDAPDINLISCGGQATIPLVYAVSRVQPVLWGEIVATVSSRSVGPGTRANIDEFTRTTRAGIEQVGGARRGKAIIIINPADPPILMRDTILCLTEAPPDQAAITDSVHAMVRDVQRYVPGYTLKNGPVFDGDRVSIWVEIEGAGDFFPPYAGNLDIMTAAAARTGDLIARHLLEVA